MGLFRNMNIKATLHGLSKGSSLQESQFMVLLILYFWVLLYLIYWIVV